jgi:hypothetical protein
MRAIDVLMKRVTVALTVTAVSILSLGASSAHAAELTRTELEAKVVGNTIHYQAGDEHVFEYLAPGGVIHGRSSVHGTYVARWRLYGDDAICFEHEDPMASGCVSVVLNGAQIEYHRRDGVVEGPFPFLQGNPENL